MLSVSETTCWLLAIPFVLAFLLTADKLFQSYARNLRTPVLNCAQDGTILRQKSSPVFRGGLRWGKFPEAT